MPSSVPRCRCKPDTAVVAIAIDLPRAPESASDSGAVAMLQRLIGPHVELAAETATLDLGGVTIREHAAPVLAVSACSSRLESVAVHHAADRVPVSAELQLLACPLAQAAGQVAPKVTSVDHVGVNFAASTVDESAWHDFVAVIARSVPAYRLEIESPNEILILLPEPCTGTRPTSDPPAVELVYDRTITCSSVHVCLRVSLEREALEKTFPKPYGGYKRGDEAYFRSIAVENGCPLPLYLDLAYAEAAFPPWSQIVQHIGRRLG